MTLGIDRLNLLGLGMLALASVLGVSGCQEGMGSPLTDTNTPTPIPPISFVHPCGPYIGGSYPGDLHEHFLHWAEGGTHLVFDHDDKILALDIAGAQLREVADADVDYKGIGGPDDGHRFAFGLYADVSPDGSRIVYSSCEYLLHEPDPRGIISEDYEIVAMNIDGTDKKRLTKNQYFDHYPVWSPDGTQIATVGSRGLYDRLIILSTDVSGRERVSPFSPALYPQVWSPNGQRLAYIANEGEVMPFSRILYTVRTDGSELSRIGDTTAVPTWSPDGEELAFVSVDGEVPVIYAARPDGMGLRTIWRGEAGTPMTSVSQVSWSPDGSELLFLSNGVYLVRPDDTGLRRLTPDLPVNQSTRAAWSPDGSRIAVYYPGRQLVTMARDGTDLRILARVDVDGGFLAKAESP